jgi:hypothetical protein
MAIDKENLFARRVDEDDVEIPGIGTVRVRAVTRHELLGVHKPGETNPAVAERRMLSAGMVDPQLSEDEVARWQKNSPPSEIGLVLDRIRQLSGLTDGASKEAYKSVRDES